MMEESIEMAGKNCSQLYQRSPRCITVLTLRTLAAITQQNEPMLVCSTWGARQSLRHNCKEDIAVAESCQIETVSKASRCIDSLIIPEVRYEDEDRGTES